MIGICNVDYLENAINSDHHKSHAFQFIDKSMILYTNIGKIKF